MSGKAIRETIGFLGLIGSLLFVGLEVRQNSITARAAAYQELGLALTDFWAEMSQDSAMTEIRFRFFNLADSADLSGFTENELNQLVSGWVGSLRQLESTWRQVELGLLDPQVLNWFGWSYGTDNRRVSLLWPRLRPFMSPDFAEFLESEWNLTP